MGGSGWSYNESMNIRNSHITNGYSFNVNGNCFAKPSGSEIAGGLIGGLLAGIGGAVASGAVAKMEQQQAVNTALAQARATISSCTSDIATLQTEISNDYGITVNDDGTIEGKSFADKKAEIDEAIDNLKDKAKLDDVTNKANLAEYRDKQETVTSMKNDLPKLETLETEFKKGPELIRGKSMIQATGADGMWALDSSITAKDFIPKKGNESDGQLIYEEAKGEADAAIKAHNKDMTSRKNILAKQNATSLEDFKTKLQTAENELTKITGENAKTVGGGLTCEQYETQMNELKTQKRKFSSPADFNAKVSEIKTLNSRRNMAQTLINSKATLDKAKLAKKNSTKGTEGRTIATNKYKTAEEQFAATWKQTVGTNYLTKSQINAQVGALGVAYGMNTLQQGLFYSLD